MIEIDDRSPVPTYEQIVQQIRSEISAGTLGKGDPLPAIRQLAQDLEINPATVAKAYQILERDGIVQTAGRRGTFVHVNAPQNHQNTMQKAALEELRSIIDRWHDRGMTSQDLKEIFNRILSNSKIRK